jgi:stage II sporulation protein AA (anti-sigma F factor antagonist)
LQARCLAGIIGIEGQFPIGGGTRPLDRSLTLVEFDTPGKELLGMAKTRRIKVNESGPVSVVTFADSKIIDEAEIQELGQELYDLVERDDRKKIVLNFANVEFLSSAALGKLIGFDKRVKQHAAELILSNIRPEIYEVFAIMKLTKLFQIKDDEADALAVL